MKILLITVLFFSQNLLASSVSIDAGTLAMPFPEEAKKEKISDSLVNQLVNEFTQDVLKSLSPEQVKKNGLKPFYQVIENKDYSFFSKNERAKYLVGEFLRSEELARALEEPRVKQAIDKDLFYIFLNRYYSNFEYRDGFSFGEKFFMGFWVFGSFLVAGLPVGVEVADPVFNFLEPMMGDWALLSVPYAITGAAMGVGIVFGHLYLVYRSFLKSHRAKYIKNATEEIKYEIKRVSRCKDVFSKGIF